jgi:hypothetical protein
VKDIRHTIVGNVSLNRLTALRKETAAEIARSRPNRRTQSKALETHLRVGLRAGLSLCAALEEPNT